MAKKRVLLTAAAAVAAVVVIGLAAVLFLRVDSGQAQNIALERAAVKLSGKKWSGKAC